MSVEEFDRRDLALPIEARLLLAGKREDFVITDETCNSVGRRTRFLTPL